MVDRIGNKKLAFILFAIVAVLAVIVFIYDYNSEVPLFSPGGDFCRFDPVRCGIFEQHNAQPPAPTPAAATEPEPTAPAPTPESESGPTLPYGGPGGVPAPTPSEPTEPELAATTSRGCNDEGRKDEIKRSFGGTGEGILNSNCEPIGLWKFTDFRGNVVWKGFIDEDGKIGGWEEKRYLPPRSNIIPGASEGPTNLLLSETIFKVDPPTKLSIPIKGTLSSLESYAYDRRRGGEAIFPIKHIEYESTPDGSSNWKRKVRNFRESLSFGGGLVRDGGYEVYDYKTFNSEGIRYPVEISTYDNGFKVKEIKFSLISSEEFSGTYQRQVSEWFPVDTDGDGVNDKGEPSGEWVFKKVINGHVFDDLRVIYASPGQPFLSKNYKFDSIVGNYESKVERYSPTDFDGGYLKFVEEKHPNGEVFKKKYYMIEDSERPMDEVEHRIWFELDKIDNYGTVQEYVYQTCYSFGINLGMKRFIDGEQVLLDLFENGLDPETGDWSDVECLEFEEV